ncbi:hypothetical protein G3I60_20445 [Streptomyces sp. SID13666]|uniref:DNA polymerase Y family protein n=1 Tax=unclassified Streptomyces TaxID=2593676 RepID=UPI0013C1DB20|nr:MULTISPECIES: hypothetical protein [unclassified Streptomyces]NEA56450.1 hypothetical protein [Streptomyces sp. SID13666]NEA75862.1 hypothetical protein [Streptomyces sp. SID13588]
MQPVQRDILHAHFHGNTRDDPELYQHLLELLENISPRVQALEPDGAQMDLTGALRYFDRSPRDIAELIRLRVVALHGVQVTLAIAGNRLLAGMAAAVTPPGDITVIGPDPHDIAMFLRPQPVSALPGVGPATVKTLTRHGLHRVGDLADAPLLTTQRLLGATTGRALYDLAHGRDPRPVTPQPVARSITSEHLFDRDELDPDQHRRVLLGLSDQLASRLRSQAQIAGALFLTARYADRSASTRTRSLPEASAHGDDIRAAAYELYAALGLQRARVRSLTLRAEQLRPAHTAAHQMSLDQVRENRLAIEPAIDKANARFGPGAVRPASLAASPQDRDV